VYILNVTNLEEVANLTNSDPAIQAGCLKMEWVKWNGSAGLMGLNDLHLQVS
jgi:predicted transcriptional regulator with HTH domain